MRTRVFACATMVASMLAMLTTGVIATPSTASTSSGCVGTHWVGAWSAAPGDAALPGFAEQSLRMITHPHLGGDVLRVRLTNRFGSQPVTFGAVRIGRSESGSAVEPGTNRRVTFGGRSAVTLPARTEVLSDPVQLNFDAFTDLAVSMYAQGVTGPATQHEAAIQTSYSTAPGSGDHTASQDGAAFTEQVGAWFFLGGLDVEAPRSVGSVVTLGDSITDGVVSAHGLFFVPDSAALGANGRYPDQLARRLAAQSGPTRLSVLNAGIAGNRVVSDGLLPAMGPSAVSRLASDVIAQPGVTDVILMEGTNDLGMTPLPSAAAVINGLDHIIRRLQTEGLHVVLGTIPPAGGAIPGYGTSFANFERLKVNTWIRTRPHGATLVDFDRALRDPAQPGRLRPEYDSGDHLHPNLAGYHVMAQTVDLDSLRGTRCARVAS